MPEASTLLAEIWSSLNLPADQLANTHLPESEPLLPSSFYVGSAAQVSIGAAASAANLLYKERCNDNQTVTVDLNKAEMECTGFYQLNGETPNAWEKFSGLYPCSDGHVRIHANFEHHRDGALSLLGIQDSETAKPEDVEKALSTWTAEDFETAAAEKNLVVSKVRSFDEWDAHSHAISTGAEPLVKLSRIGDAEPLTLPCLEVGQRPLHSVKVLDLTRILAGPICGRTLAAYGADVMLLNSPHLPNIPAIIDTSRGKRSTHLDLRDGAAVGSARKLVSQSHIFVQGYRPGGLETLGFGPSQLAEARPGIIYVSLSAYGGVGPWQHRRGFDSLVQTATGFNHAEAEAAGQDTPRAMPVQILDYASGFFMAFAAQAAFYKQLNEGGSWHVEISLLQTANWLRGLGRIDNGFDKARLSLKDHLELFPCSQGELRGVPHAAEFSKTPAVWLRQSKMPGEDPASFD